MCKQKIAFDTLLAMGIRMPKWAQKMFGAQTEDSQYLHNAIGRIDKKQNLLILGMAVMCVAFCGEHFGWIKTLIIGV